MKQEITINAEIERLSKALVEAIYDQVRRSFQEAQSESENSFDILQDEEFCKELMRRRDIAREKKNLIPAKEFWARHGVRA